MDRDVPLEVNWADFAVQTAGPAALIPLLKELEFTG